MTGWHDDDCPASFNEPGQECACGYAQGDMGLSTAALREHAIRAADPHGRGYVVVDAAYLLRILDALDARGATHLRQRTTGHVEMVRLPREPTGESHRRRGRPFAPPEYVAAGVRMAAGR